MIQPEAYYWDYAPDNGFAASTETSIQEVLNQAYQQFTGQGYTVYISKDRLYGGMLLAILFETGPNNKGKQQHYIKFMSLQHYESFMRQWAVLLPTLYLHLQPIIEKHKEVLERRQQGFKSPMEIRAYNKDL